MGERSGPGSLTVPPDLPVRFNPCDIMQGILQDESVLVLQRCIPGTRFRIFLTLAAPSGLTQGNAYGIDRVHPSARGISTHWVSRYSY
jgi:hypothetical protein